MKVPDHKTRLAATTLSRAYHEGKPIERKEVLTANAKDFPKLVELLNQSPAFKALKNSEQSTTEVIVPPQASSEAQAEEC